MSTTRTRRDSGRSVAVHAHSAHAEPYRPFTAIGIYILGALSEPNLLESPEETMEEFLQRLPPDERPQQNIRVLTKACLCNLIKNEPKNIGSPSLYSSSSSEPSYTLGSTQMVPSPSMRRARSWPIIEQTTSTSLEFRFRQDERSSQIPSSFPAAPHMKRSCTCNQCERVRAQLKDIHKSIQEDSRVCEYVPSYDDDD